MQVIEQLIGFIAPHYCIECGAEGQLLCGSCAQDVFSSTRESCVFCMRLSTIGGLCTGCRQQSALDSVWTLGEYEGVCEKLIHLLKFERAGAAHGQLAEEWHRRLPSLPSETLVVPLPTAPRRVRQRGYDQSVLLAKRFARYRGLRCAPLVERKHNARQVGATRTERHVFAAQAYKLKNNSVIRGVSLLLIDDVITTGASLKAAATLFADAGSGSVMAAVVAKRTFKK